MAPVTAITAAAFVSLLVSTAMAAERRVDPRLAPSSPVHAAQSAPAADADDSVAVVTFSNISGAAEDDWIGRGIAETLTADLEGGGRVLVFGHQAVSHALETLSAGRDARIEATWATEIEAGRLLGSRWIVSGGYQRLGDRVRVIARVVEVATATVIHTAKVDGLMPELFGLQDRLSAELRRGLPAGGGRGTTSAAARAPTRSEPVNGALEPPAPAPADATTASRGRGFVAPATAAIIDGPPPPVAPEIVARDAAGGVTVRAVRLAEPFRLDGRLDETIYETVQPVSGFIQQLPDEGEPATERTEAWVSYDAQNVYVSARLWDSAPESQWIANEMQRDSTQLIQNDTFRVALDTFYDRRNASLFMVNPIGGFRDVEISDEGNPNSDWNPVWDVRTGRFDGGWTVEMEIPFKSLRYRSGGVTDLGAPARATYSPEETNRAISHRSPFQPGRAYGVCRRLPR